MRIKYGHRMSKEVRVITEISPMTSRVKKKGLSKCKVPTDVAEAVESLAWNAEFRGLEGAAPTD